MASTAFDGLDQFLDELGEGDLVGRVVVDQVYAKYQHERADLKHPDGGEPFYLRNGLFEPVERWVAELGDHLVTPEGPRLRDGMQHVAEGISDEVYKRAPFEFGDLRGSGHPTVEDDGAVVYDRPPNVARLSDSDLEAKGDLHRAFGRF